MQRAPVVIRLIYFVRFVEDQYGKRNTYFFVCNKSYENLRKKLLSSWADPG